MTMLIRVAALLTALLIAACVPTSESPILAKKGESDAALIGSWSGTMADGLPVYMHYLMDKEGGITALLVTGAQKPKEEGGWAVFRLVSAEVRGTRYLSALWDLNDGKPVEGREKGYHLMRYAFGPGEKTLRLFGVNEEKLMAAVKAGKVEGRIEGKDMSAEVRLTASSERLATFLKRSDPADLFDRPFVTLTRIAE